MMKRMRLPLALMAALPGLAVAGGWDGTGELGYAYARGNSETETFNAALKGKKEDGAWLYEANAAALYAQGQVKLERADGSAGTSSASTANRYDLGGKVGYKFGERGYVFGSGRYDHDQFAPLDWQTVVSAGYGQRLIKNASSELTFEVGPGIRQFHEVAGGRQGSDAVGRGALNFKHRLTGNTELANTLLVESGENRTFVQNDIGAQVKVNARLALKSGLQLRYHSDAPSGTSSSDTLLTTNVVLGF
jgi:putative salt-induced outer membrane protein